VTYNKVFSLALGRKEVKYSQREEFNTLRYYVIGKWESGERFPNETPQQRMT